MTDRETVEITTPVENHKVVLKEWLTGRERRNIRSVLLEGVSFSAGGKDEAVPDYKFDGSSLDKMQDKSLETVVVSIDGSNENIVNKVLEMREQDYEFVLKEIDKITGGNLTEEGKKK